MKYFIYSIIGIVAVAILAGFFVVGSPGESRLRRFDDQRVMDLQIIQERVIYSWQRTGKLPETLEALRDDISGFNAPRDPESGENYSYEIGGPLQFTLCANFSRPSASAENSRTAKPVYAPEGIMPYPADNWSHDAGRVCFERTINPELYKPVPGQPF